MTVTAADVHVAGRSGPAAIHGPARTEAGSAEAGPLVLRTCRRCGYAGQYRSPALAAFHHPRHSCDRQHRRTAAVARRATRRLAPDAGRRDCQHPCAGHRHGTRAAYVKDRCRCTPCTAANAAARRGARRRKQLGVCTPYVPSGAARAHVRRLHAAGFGRDRISQLSGVSPSTLHQLLSTGPTGQPLVTKIRPDTARRLLALDPATVRPAPGSHVDGRGTRRRLQALIARGWNIDLLAHRLQRTPARLAHTLTADAVAVHTARGTRALYDQLWDKHPPQRTQAEADRALAARVHARAHGWAPPLAWDDIDTDPEPADPSPGPATSKPRRAGPAPLGKAHADQVADWASANTTGRDDVDEVAIERAVAGDGIAYHQLTLPERAEAVRRLTQRGHSLRDIARQLDITTRTVSRRRADQRAA